MTSPESFARIGNFEPVCRRQIPIRPQLIPAECARSELHGDGAPGPHLGINVEARLKVEVVGRICRSVNRSAARAGSGGVDQLKSDGVKAGFVRSNAAAVNVAEGIGA